MGFLGISGNTWKTVGKIALKAAPIIAAPFTGGASLLALGAGAGALSGALDGGGWKGALLGGALGAIPGGGAGAAAGGAAKLGVKELAKGLAKGAVTNFATGTGSGLVTGQGLKRSLAGGGQSALSGLGTTGAGGLAQGAKTVGKNVALNAGTSFATRGLEKAGVPGMFAAQGGNVFRNYLGDQFNPSSAPNQSAISTYLPQTSGGSGGGSASGGGGVDWKSALLGLGTSAAKGLIDRGTGGGTGGGSTGQTFPQQTPVSGGYAWENAPTPAPAGGGNPSQPASWAERYGPLIAQGAGVAVGGLVGRQATKSAMNRSPEEQAALAGAQGAAGQAGRAGAQSYREGRGYLQKPAQYFQTLLGGNRAAMSQAIAGPAAQITGNYRGAERNLNQQGIRGAARDQAAADLNRQRVSQIAGLTTGMQPYAAEQLASLGQNVMGQAPGLMATSGNIYGNLLGSGAANRVYGREEGEKTGAAIGGLARDVGEVVFRKGQPAPSGPASTTPKPPTQAPAQTGLKRLLPQQGGTAFGAPGDYDPYRQQRVAY